MTVLECIDPAKWNDTIIDMPDNRVIISKSGLKLCLEDRIIPARAEIIYIVDLSSSMNPACGTNAGDPYKKRPESLHAAFQYQIDSLPQTHAGYIGFHSFVEMNHCLKPTSVNTPAGISLLHDKVNELQNWVNTHENNTVGYGTNYQAAIDTAIQNFSNPSILDNTSRIIIFISGGEPDSGLGATSAQIQLLQNKYIKVYGIFLGFKIGTGLDSICLRTNGQIYLVPPSCTDTIITILKRIKKEVEPYHPVTLTITNNSLGTSSVGASFFKPSDTVWQTVLNKPLPLKSNLNTIQVNSLFSTPSGHDTTLNFKFTLNVGGDTTHTPCCAYCWHRTHMNININNIPVDTLSSQNNTYTLKFFYYGTDTLTQATILARTITKGDSETITMTNPVFDGKKWIFSKTVPFQILSGNPVHNNGVTEAALNDEITFYWRHPYILMDTAFAKVSVVSPTFSSTGFLPLNNRHIKILQTKNSRGTVITVQFSAPVKNARVTLTAPNGRIVSACKGTDTRQIAVATTRFSNGVYFITVAAGQETITRKIILAQ